jgi:hypothetical protein
MKINDPRGRAIFDPRATTQCFMPNILPVDFANREEGFFQFLQCTYKEKSMNPWGLANFDTYDRT